MPVINPTLRLFGNTIQNVSSFQKKVLGAQMHVVLNGLQLAVENSTEVPEP